MRFKSPQSKKEEGDEGLVSRKRGKPSNHRMDIEIGDKVREFIKRLIMKGFGPTMMAEKLEMQKGICLSKETVRRMVIAEDIREAKSKKKEEPHLSRARRNKRGELVQIDGSSQSCVSPRLLHHRQPPRTWFG